VTGLEDLGNFELAVSKVIVDSIATTIEEECLKSMVDVKECMVEIMVKESHIEWEEMEVDRGCLTCYNLDSITLVQA